MNYADLLDGFAGKRALIVGDLMLDEYIFGSATRISPEAPVMVIRHKRTTHVPGVAANVARNVEALGGKATLVGVIGADEGGDLLEKSMHDERIGECLFVQDVGRQTTRKTRVLADHAHQVLRIDAEDDEPIDPAIEEQLLKIIESRIEGSDVVIFSDYLKGAITSNIAKVGIEMARKAGVPVVVNPKPRSVDFYREATVVSLNRSEATAAAGAERSLENEAVLDAAESIRNRLKVDAVLVTLGEAGMVVAKSDPVSIPAVTVEVADPAGAGDTVISTVALGIASVGLEERVFALAAETAAAVVRHVGVAAPSKEDLARIRSAG